MADSKKRHLWRYQHQGMFTNDPEGPVTEEELIQLVKNEKIKKGTLVASPTRTKGEWVEAGNFNPIANLIEKQAKSKQKARQQKARQKEEALPLPDAVVEPQVAQHLQSEPADRTITEGTRQYPMLKVVIASFWVCGGLLILVGASIFLFAIFVILSNIYKTDQYASQRMEAGFFQGFIAAGFLYAAVINFACAEAINVGLDIQTNTQITARQAAHWGRSND